MIDEETELNPRDRLIGFLNRVLEFLRVTINEPYGDEGIFVVEEMVPRLRAAWDEFSTDFDVPAAERQIVETTDDTLRSYGLYGSQLHAKLAIFNLRLARFTASRTKRLLGKLLPSIDSILDTLIGATGINEAIKEIKELLGNSIDD